MDLRRLTWAASMAAGIVFGSAPVLANWINLAAGSGGTIMVPAQSYNENRGVNITVIGPNALHVQSMRLDGLNVYGTASLSARIYNGSCAVIASGSATTSGGNHLSVTIPISGTLAVGQSYRLAIDVLTTPMWQGSGDLFVNNHFPYVEPSGNLRINNASMVPWALVQRFRTLLCRR